jgi:transmembrane sensor
MPAISEELLKKFQKGLCTKAEAAMVEAYFQQHPEDEFLLDEYESQDAKTPLPEAYRQEMLEAIVWKTAVKRNGRIRVIRSFVAAASVILLVAGWGLLSRRTVTTEKNTDPAALIAWVGKHNSDKKKMRILLPDSSEVVLSPGATIRYRKDFGLATRREIRVEGQAAFTVTKYKQTPFVVLSEGLSTTVLGTIFEVTAEKSSDQISVRLLEGKVLVGLDSLMKESTRHYILSAGEEFVFAKWNKSVVIREFRNHGGGYAASRVTRLPAQPDSLSNWYMFNNQALADVFDQLAILYNVDIQYSREELRNSYFIGKLEKKDSLSKIMSDIALLNHLSVTVKDGRYLVKRRKR